MRIEKQLLISSFSPSLAQGIALIFFLFNLACEMKFMCQPDKEEVISES